MTSKILIKHEWDKWTSKDKRRGEVLLFAHVDAVNDGNEAFQLDACFCLRRGIPETIVGRF